MASSRPPSQGSQMKGGREREREKRTGSCTFIRCSCAEDGMTIDFSLYIFQISPFYTAFTSIWPTLFLPPRLSSTSQTPWNIRLIHKPYLHTALDQTLTFRPPCLALGAFLSHTPFQSTHAFLRLCPSTALLHTLLDCVLEL